MCIGDIPSDGPPVCPQLQMREEYAFLQCNGDMFNDTQCEQDGRCYCVDTITGSRLNDIVVMEEDRATLDCTSEPQ